jgi:hypothetical protein
MAPSVSTAPADTAPAPIKPSETPPDEIIAQLRADLTEDRARLLRLEEYIAEVLGAEPPDDQPVPAWEGPDFGRYWDERAADSLKDDDRARVNAYRRGVIPVMGYTVAELFPVRRPA